MIPSVFAQTFPGVSLAVSEEVVPAGGVAQIKVSLTEPKPIVRTDFMESFSDAYFDAFLGISASGLTGVAQYRNGYLRLELSNGTAVTPPLDYPVVTIAARTRTGLPVGRTTAVALDLAQSLWVGADGLPYAEEAKAGSVTTGGTFFVSDVIPGGGLIRAGERFRVLGRGFTSRVKVRCEGARLVGVTPTELLVEAKQDLQLNGLRIVVDIDKETQTYYSYLRGVPGAPSAHPALARMKPVFSADAAKLAAAPLLPQTGMVNAIGLQNPTGKANDLTLSAQSLFGEKLAEVRVTLDARQEIFRTAEELFGTGLPVGTATLQVQADKAFQLAVAQVSADGASITAPAVVILQPASY